MNFVPRWYINKKTLSGGRRLEKYIPFSPPKSAIVKMDESRSKQLQGLTGGSCDFKHWEYRFLMAELNDKMEPKFAVCRCCGSTFGMKSARDNHRSTSQCCLRIVRAYELLKKDRKCVMCNEVTSQERWGVPLCRKDNCVLGYLYLEATPGPLAAALNLVGDM